MAKTQRSTSGTNGDAGAVEASAHALTPDPHNANKGSSRGQGMLEESITRYGLGRGIVVDKHGVVIAGNKTHEVALERGLVKTRIVKTRGDELVVTQREDLDLSDPDPSNPARMLAYADNRVSEVSLEWNAEILKEATANGLDLAPFFFEDELKAMTIAEVTAPGEFPSVDENIKTEHMCPKCGYEWSGKE